jgi:uncharacterized protein
MDPAYGGHMLALRTTLPLSRLEKSREQIRAFLSQKDYPCLAAQRSLKKEEFLVGLYGKFGAGEGWRELRASLLSFLAEQKRTGSPYLSYWAIFEPETMSEEDFERGLWSELSLLTSEEDKSLDWAPGKTTDPEDKSFIFSLGGCELFVVGLHALSSRKSRRFPFPALVFNAFSQFESFKEKGIYEGLVGAIREREVRFEGSVNPMAEEHGEKWETIQFSGKANPKEWKCPFHFLRQKEKPQ